MIIDLLVYEKNENPGRDFDKNLRTEYRLDTWEETGFAPFERFIMRSKESVSRMGYLKASKRELNHDSEPDEFFGYRAELVRDIRKEIKGEYFKDVSSVGDRIVELLLSSREQRLFYIPSLMLGNPDNFYSSDVTEFSFENNGGLSFRHRYTRRWTSEELDELRNFLWLKLNESVDV